MRRNRFSEEQIIGILKEPEIGGSVVDLCAKPRVIDGGMDVSAALASRRSAARRR
jgi:putative transposase